MHKYEAIIFDLDDTLYPEKAYVFSGFRAVAIWTETHLGLPATRSFNQLTALFAQGARGNTFNQWLETLGQSATADLVSQLVKIYREHEPVLTPFPEIPPLLDHLQKYYRLGIVSDGYLFVQQRKWTALGLAHYFEAVVFSDEWGRAAWKPSPKPFQVVLQRLNATAAHSLYIADNPVKDFLGARQVGMDTLWLHRPDGEYSHLTPPTEHHAAAQQVVKLGEDYFDIR